MSTEFFLSISYTFLYNKLSKLYQVETAKIYYLTVSVDQEFRSSLTGSLLSGLQSRAMAISRFELRKIHF